MPLGNLTSQFFANVYLNELDQFVKHTLKAKYYIRYVDDFVILHSSKNQLENWKQEINYFLKNRLKIELHNDKSKILQLSGGIGFLGFRIFLYHRLIKKKNLHRFKKKFIKLFDDYKKEIIKKEKVIEILQGWLAYFSHANTFEYQKKIIKIFDELFPTRSSKNKITIDKRKYKYINDIQYKKIKPSFLRTLYLYNKNLGVKEIEIVRDIKEATIWEHSAKLIQMKKLNVFDILSKNKVFKILSKIKTKEDKLKDIKERLNSISITYDEINCVLAMVKSSKRN